MITKFSETIDKTNISNLNDNSLIRSIASNIINKNKCEYEIGIECFYCWHDMMNDLRIWTLVKGKQEGAVSAVFSSSIIECLYPGVLKMINKINEFKNFNFLFSKNHNEVSYDNSKYLFSNQVNNKSKFLLLENIGLEEQNTKKTDALVKLNIIKNKYSQQYFYISENCSHA